MSIDHNYLKNFGNNNFYELAKICATRNCAELIRSEVAKNTCYKEIFQKAIDYLAIKRQETALAANTPNRQDFGEIRSSSLYTILIHPRIEPRLDYHLAAKDVAYFYHLLKLQKLSPITKNETIELKSVYGNIQETTAIKLLKKTFFENGCIEEKVVITNSVCDNLRKYPLTKIYLVCHYKNNEKLESSCCEISECFLEHAKAYSINYMIDICKNLFAGILHDKIRSIDHDDFKKQLGILRYFFTHTSPYKRGSAAIGEWLEESICKALSLQIQKSSSLPCDLKAFAIISLNDFIDLHYTLFNQFSSCDNGISKNRFSQIFYYKLICSLLEDNWTEIKELLENHNDSTTDIFDILLFTIIIFFESKTLFELLSSKILIPTKSLSKALTICYIYRKTDEMMLILEASHEEDLEIFAGAFLKAAISKDQKQLHFFHSFDEKNFSKIRSIAIQKYLTTFSFTKETAIYLIGKSTLDEKSKKEIIKTSLKNNQINALDFFLQETDPIELMTVEEYLFYKKTKNHKKGFLASLGKLF